MAESCSKKPYHEQVADEMIRALENGTAPWIKPWEPGAPSGGPVNALTGKPYRGINHLRLGMMQFGYGSDDPRWCTYNQAQELGAQVRKGSRGVLVQYVKQEDRKLLRDDKGHPLLDENGQKRYEVTKLERPRIFHAVVFHASQIENLPPLPKEEVKPETAFERQERSEKLLQASGATIRHDQTNRAFYRPATDSIHLPKREQFHTPDGYYATALHELGHWTGHESRLNREMLGHPFGSSEYAREELRAEIASYMLGRELGIGHDPGQHHAYVASWIEALKKDPKEIIRAAKDAEQIKDYVLGLDREKQTERLQEESSPSTPESVSAPVQEEATRAMPTASGPVQAGPSRPAPGKTWLNVSYAEKNEAKGFGAKWDGRVRRWFAPPGTDLEPLRKWLPGEQEQPRGSVPLGNAPKPESPAQAGPRPASEKTWLNVPYAEKEEAKRFGAKWDGKEKRWFAPQGTDLNPLRQWLPTSEQERTRQPAPAVVAPQVEFGDRLRQAGLIIEGEPVMNGERQNVPVRGGKPGSLDGAYQGGFTDGRPNGTWQNRKTGEQGKWIASGHILTAEAKQELRQKCDARRAAAEEARQGAGQFVLEGVNPAHKETRINARDEEGVER